MPLRILVVDRHVDRARQLTDALEQAGYLVTCIVRDDVDLYREVQRIALDVIIVSMDSPCRDTLECIQSISADQPRPIVMFSNTSDEGTIHAAIRAGVSAYVVDGLQPHRLKPIMDVAIARFREHQSLQEELRQARTTLAKRKTIDRAKGILMKQRGLSEQEAYTALRKMAMSRNKKLVDIAESVIIAFNVLG